jgi:hypothetical protein
VNIWRPNSWQLHGRLGVRLALLAALTLALLPSVSRALSPLSPAQFMPDLCRSADSAPEHTVAHSLTACGLCVVAAAPVLPSSLSSGFLCVMAAPAWPLALAVWLPARAQGSWPQPRAPPSAA